jgi:hypothetical protein
MSLPPKSDRANLLGDDDADGARPLVTWQEPSPLAYEVVELPAVGNTHVKPSLPPLDMVFRPHFTDVPDIATPEERDQAAYQAAPAGANLAAAQERSYREARLQELLAYSRRIRRPRRPAVRRLETHWYQCIVLPFMAWRLLIGLSAGLALGTLLALPFEGNNLIPWHIRYLVPLVFVVWVCGYLQCILHGAVRGDPPAVIWPGRQFDVALRYTGWWAFCFLAGPAPLAMAAVLYWIHCGEMDFLDGLILVQVGVLFVSYLLFVLLAVARSQRLYDANPVRVAQLVHGLGYRSAVLIVLATLLSFENARYLLFAMELAHENVAGSWVLLTLYWLSALACATFVLRLAGWWTFRHITLRP